MSDLRVISIMMYQLFDKTLPPLLVRHWSVIQVKFDISVNWYVFNFRNRPVHLCERLYWFCCLLLCASVCFSPAKYPRTAICSLVAVAMVTAWLFIAAVLLGASKSLPLFGWPACNVWIGLLTFKSLGQWDFFGLVALKEISYAHQG